MNLNKPLIPIVDAISQVGVIYIGKAKPGTSQNAAAWVIQKYSITGIITCQLAQGSAELNQKWTDRLTLNYF